jgi:hypothetical protein
MTVAPALYSSARSDWNTPAEVLDPVRAFNDGEPPGLDPCSNEQSIVGARLEWRLERGEDGLVRSWRGFGLVFVNWPYDDSLAWARKMAEEARDGVEILGLGPARTDTEWFQSYASRADVLCFWRGRLKFGPAIADTRQPGLFGGAPRLRAAEETAPFPSMLLYWGQRVRRFGQVFSQHGRVWR